MKYHTEKGNKQELNFSLYYSYVKASNKRDAKTNLKRVLLIRSAFREEIQRCDDTRV